MTMTEAVTQLGTHNVLRFLDNPDMAVVGSCWFDNSIRSLEAYNVVISRPIEAYDVVNHIRAAEKGA